MPTILLQHNKCLSKFATIICTILLSGCSAHSGFDNKNPFTSVVVDTLLSDKISIRAILVDKEKIWYGAENGRYGFYDLNSHQKHEKRISDTMKSEFRSIAMTEKEIFVINAGSPALLYKISKATGEVKLVYRENHPKAFYDSMRFWNETEGIAIGDPTHNCISILITRDGGQSWIKTPCSDVLKTADGEAAFAASNTNVIVKGNNAWIVSGGSKARVFHSGDKGKNWKVYPTPIVQGGTMTGIFTADFYNETTGIIAGGDYEKPRQNSENKAVTNDGGKTWKLIAENKGFGYASCIQFIPKSNGKGMVSVGATGLYYSHDGGNTWKQFLMDKDLYTIRFFDGHTAYAAGRNKIIRIEFKK